MGFPKHSSGHCHLCAAVSSCLDPLNARPPAFYLPPLPPFLEGSLCPEPLCPHQQQARSARQVNAFWSSLEPVLMGRQCKHPASLFTEQESLKVCVLCSLPEVPSRLSSSCPQGSLLMTHPLSASFPSLFHFPPPSCSQKSPLTLLPSNPWLRLCFWENPNYSSQ